MPKFWMWQSSEDGRVLNMGTLHSVLNMLEYDLIVLNVSYVLSILGFWIWQSSEYARVTQGPKYASIWSALEKLL